MIEKINIAKIKTFLPNSKKALLKLFIPTLSSSLKTPPLNRHRMHHKQNILNVAQNITPKNTTNSYFI
jgi:hypothetical protein